MDAQTRHELKQNELQQMLSGFGFLKTETGRNVTLAVIAIVVLYGGYRLWSWNSGRSAFQSWTALMSTNVPNAIDGAADLGALREIVSSAGDARLRAWAELRLGCGLLRQANFDPTKREQYTNDAVEVLEQLSSAAGTPATIAAAAEFAMANAYEMQRNFEQAKATYQAIADNERYAGSPYQTLAGERAESIDDLTTAVIFTPGAAPRPDPIVSPTSQPSSASAPVASQPAAPTSQPGATSSPDQPAASKPADGEKTQP